MKIYDIYESKSDGKPAYVGWFADINDAAEYCRTHDARYVIHSFDDIEAAVKHCCTSGVSNQ